jgi:hypothetical protein
VVLELVPLSFYLNIFLTFQGNTNNYVKDKVLKFSCVAMYCIRWYFREILTLIARMTATKIFLTVPFHVYPGIIRLWNNKLASLWAGIAQSV